MRVGILGSGTMARTLGGAWRRAGHDVLVGGRNLATAAAAAAEIGAAGHGTPADAARHGDAVLVAVPADAAPELARDLAGLLAGRTVIDCTNQLAPGADGPELTTGGVPVARRIADAAPDARVVKAFNLCHSSIWALPRPVFQGEPLAVPICGDDPAAVDLAAALAGAIGCVPLRCGGLSRAAYLEATAAFAIGVWWSGGEPRFAFPAPGEAA
ncbi:NAD(P)-binding domain-containing protein [Microtetraspora sp. AC03309]|uniref:NADPH-dependent F420 reductase n=1 Tax=Microtetraspora sp. AC03309 TaxID=2779376 RepID=UPI001E5C4DE7|nr:NAD(P)-binding domain-containing protein [Microtetraspora sp. AC03309]MCC5581793.1 NAD(P)-binding domain-containing protein [Microtetraspora sp. AC03309]